MHGSAVSRSSYATCASSSLNAMHHDLAAGSGLPSAPRALILWPMISQPPPTSPRCRFVSSMSSTSPLPSSGTARYSIMQ